MKSVLLFLLLNALIFPQVVWEKLNPPSRAEVVEILSINDSIILAGTKRGSLFRSENSGQTWTPVIYGTNSSGNNGTRYILKTHDGEILLNLMGALYSSTDNGLSWNYISDEGGSHVTLLSSGDIFKAYGSHLLRSTDNGLSWVYVNILDPPAHIFVESIDSAGDELFISGYYGFYHSDDLGETWSEIDSARFHDTYLYTIFAKSADTLLVQSFNSFYYSTDGGEEWQPLNNGVDVENLGRVKFYSFESVLYMTTKLGLYYFNEATWAWQLYNTALEGISTKCVEFVSDKILCGTSQILYELDVNSANISGKGIMEASPGKILLNNDGDIFYNTSKGFFKQNFQTREWSQLDPEIFCAGSGSFILKDSMMFAQGCGRIYYFSSDRGETWSGRGFFDGFAYGMVIAARNNRVSICRYEPFASNWIDGYWYTDNFGSTWKAGPYYTGAPRNIGSDMVISKGERVFTTFSDGYGNDFGVFHYPASTQHFSKLNDGLSDSLIVKLCVDNFENILAANSEGLLYNNLSINHWHPLNESFTEIKDIQFSGDNQLAVINGTTLWLLGEDDIWQDIGSQIPEGVELCYFDSENYLYAANPYGELYVTQSPLAFNASPSAPESLYPQNNAVIVDSSVVFSWEKSIPYNMYYQFEISESDQFENPEILQVFSDTLEYSSFSFSGDFHWRLKAVNFASESIYSEVRKLTYAGPTSISSDPPLVFALAQNFPNPFNGTTTFKYTLPENADVEVAVYNVLGENIYQENLGEMERGIHYYKYNSLGNTSGIYIVRLVMTDTKNNRNSLIRKIILLK
ncbi:MAG: hypothetical protein SCALA702_04510 [Melioribacteraceae bacterium]|nr:MAG: hypothetical protein SCALA702_04510 [Melioribacteraceae bacterium]